MWTPTCTAERRVVARSRTASSPNHLPITTYQLPLTTYHLPITTALHDCPLRLPHPHPRPYLLHPPHHTDLLPRRQPHDRRGPWHLGLHHHRPDHAPPAHRLLQR